MGNREPKNVLKAGSKHGSDAGMVNRPAVFTGFSALNGGMGSGMGGFTTNEEPSPGSSSTTPNRSPMWAGNLSLGGGDFEAKDEWEEAQKEEEDIDEDILEETRGSGESMRAAGMSSTSMVNYRWRKGHMIGAGSYGPHETI